MFSHSILVIISLALCYSFVISHDEYDFVFTPEAKLAPRVLLATQHGDVIEEIATDQFTFCTYAFVVDHPKSKLIALVSYSSTATDKENEIILGINYERHYTLLVINGVDMQFAVVPRRGQWTHICLTWSNKEGTAEMYIDGRNKGMVTDLKKHYLIGKKGHLILGQGRSEDNEEFLPEHGVRGRLTQFHFWNKKLTGDEVKQAQSCHLHGNVVNWLNSTWKFFEGVEVKPSSAPCPAESQCLEELSETEATALSTLDPPRCPNPTISKMDKTEFTPIDATQATLEQEPVELPISTLTDQLSWCISFYVESKLMTPLASYRDNTRIGELSFSVEGELLTLTDPRNYVSVWGIVSHKWQHVCMTWSGVDQFMGLKDTVRLYVNGKLAADTVFDNSGGVFGGGRIYYFHSQYDAFDTHNPTKGFALKVTGMDLWNSVLTPAQVLETYKCRENLRGNTLAWNGTNLED